MINEDEVKNWLISIEKCDSFCDHSGQNGGTELFERLNELVVFLKELNEFMTKKGNPRAVLQEIPSVGKLLGKLVQNSIVQCTEEVVEALFCCVLALASHAEDERDNSTRKTIVWSQSQIKHMTSPSPACPASVLVIGDVIGNTATELTQTMSQKLVYSLCHDIMKEVGTKWNPSINNLVPSLKHDGWNVRHLSEMCIPLLNQPVIRALIESLLLTGNSSTDLILSSSDENFNVMECLSPMFLDLVTEMTRQTQLYPNIEGCGFRDVLSYNALVALWRRYQPSFESQVLEMVELAVLRYPDTSVERIKAMFASCYLTKACVNNAELRAAALQIIYTFLHSHPESTRLQVVLTAFNESCFELQR